MQFINVLVFTLLGSLHGESLLEANYDSKFCYELKAIPHITKSSSKFGANIEGSSVDKEGNMYATNFGTSETKYQIGQTYPFQKLVYTDSDKGAYLNGIRIVDGKFYLADAVKHRVLQLTKVKGKLESKVYCSNPTMIQPNDLTVTKGGIVFTSGGRYTANTDNTNGDVWVCAPQHKVVKRFDLMGRTNGVELSPDEKFLYVSESYTKEGQAVVQKIWKYEIDYTTFSFKSKKLFVDFKDLDGSVSQDIDGMRFDVKGNLFVTRHSGSKVVVLNAIGKIIANIHLNFPRPTNVEFGGKDGKTLFITGQCKEDTTPEVGNGCVDKLEWYFPGNSFTKQQ